MNLNDKVSIITGGASGIGAATCRAFAAAGAKVVVVDVNADGAKKVASEFGGLAVACDISNEQAINELVKRTEDELGQVDVFFSNAGIATGAGPPKLQSRFGTINGK